MSNQNNGGSHGAAEGEQSRLHEEAGKPAEEDVVDNLRTELAGLIAYCEQIEAARAKAWEHAHALEAELAELRGGTPGTDAKGGVDG